VAVQVGVDLGGEVLGHAEMAGLEDRRLVGGADRVPRCGELLATRLDLLIERLDLGVDLGVDDTRVPLAYIAFLIRERRFDQVGPALAPWLIEPPAGADKGAVDAWLDAMELALDDQWENFRFDEALATNEKLRKNKRPGLSKARETPLYALDGDFDQAPAELKKRLRGKGYPAALGDLASEFALHRVPPMDLGCGMGRRRNTQDCAQEHARERCTNGQLQRLQSRSHDKTVPTMDHARLLIRRS